MVEKLMKKEKMRRCEEKKMLRRILRVPVGKTGRKKNARIRYHY